MILRRNLSVCVCAFVLLCTVSRKRCARLFLHMVLIENYRAPSGAQPPPYEPYSTSCRLLASFQFPDSTMSYPTRDSVPCRLTTPTSSATTRRKIFYYSSRACVPTCACAAINRNGGATKPILGHEALLPILYSTIALILFLAPYSDRYCSYPGLCRPATRYSYYNRYWSY